jgi:hypothetical protein
MRCRAGVHARLVSTVKQRVRTSPDIVDDACAFALDAVHALPAGSHAIVALMGARCS